MKKRCEQYASTVKAIMHLTRSHCSILNCSVESQCMQVTILDVEFCANQGLAPGMVKEGCKHKVAIIQLRCYKM